MFPSNGLRLGRILKKAMEFHAIENNSQNVERENNHKLKYTN